MGIIKPRPPMRKGERRKVENRLAQHAQMMRQLEAEGWEREAASTEALRMLREIEKAR